MSALPVDPIPEPDRKRVRRKDARPHEIVDAALDVFAEKGFAATKAEDIAARAGIGKGTLYLYFDSKEALLRAVVDQKLQHVEYMREMLRAHQGPISDFLIDAMQEWWVREGETKLIAVPRLIMTEGGNFPEITAYYFDQVVRPIHEIISTALMQGVASAEFAPLKDPLSVVRSLVSGVLFLVNCKYCFSAQMAELGMEPKGFLRDHTTLILNGLRTRAPAGAKKAP